MKIKFYAHASFRLEGQADHGDPIAVVTDPYTPHLSHFDPIQEPADVVLMSSSTDTFHADPSHVGGEPVVVNTVEVAEGGTTVAGLHVDAYPTFESLTYDYKDKEPDENAMYRFALDGISVLHIGDVGSAIPQQHLDALRGKVDVLLALTGGAPTIELDDLDEAIRQLSPSVVIPMHYFSERGVIEHILPVDEFTRRYPSEQVTHVGAAEMTLTREDLNGGLNGGPRIYVLEQSR